MLAADKLEAIVKSKSNDPRILAELAGGDPRSFYRGANFNNADLRGVDLRGYNLTAATFENAWLDRNTKVDEEFLEVTGLVRTVLELPRKPGEFIMGKLSSRLLVREPLEIQLGDLVEEALRELDALIVDWEAFFKKATDGGVSWIPVDQEFIDLVKAPKKNLLWGNPEKIDKSRPLLARSTDVRDPALEKKPDVGFFQKSDTAGWVPAGKRPSRKAPSVEITSKILRTTVRNRYFVRGLSPKVAILTSPLRKIVRLSSLRGRNPEIFCSELLLTFVSVKSKKRAGFTSWVSLH